MRTHIVLRRGRYRAEPHIRPLPGYLIRSRSRWPSCALVCPGSDTSNDDHADHDHSANLPALTAVSPVSGKAGTTFTVTLTGTNLQGTSDVIFALPAQFPGNSEDHGKGRGLSMLAKDSAFAVSGISVNAAGTQVTATVTVAGGAVKGARVVIASTPNGESSFVLGGGDTFTIVP